MKKLIVLCLLLVTIPAWGDLLSDLTSGVLSCPATTEMVSHWSMKNGDFGGGAGFGILSVGVSGVTVTAEATAVGFQSRQSAGIDIALPLKSDVFDPIIKGLHFGVYAGWNYQTNMYENYTDLKWLGFDWGLSIIKRF